MQSLLETPGLVSLLRRSTDRRAKMAGGGIFRMFKLRTAFTSGCKMAALAGRPNKSLLSGNSTTITLFGYRRGRVSLAIQENPTSAPIFLLELPMLTSSLHKEMASGLVKIALESETKTHKKRLVEECMWAVYCNGRKSGYSMRKKQASDEERHVMQLLRGVSYGRRRLALCLGEGRSRRGVDVHESAVREGGGIQGLRGAVYDQPRRHRRPGAEHLPCEDEVNSIQLSASCHVV
ncbi:unnamed protein product [Musa textilis]